MTEDWSRLAGGCLSSCTVDIEGSEAYSEEEDSEDEEFEWPWFAVPKWGAFALPKWGALARRVCR
jgi:hypothetical protein